MTLFPAVRIEGVNLVLRIKGRPDLSPFITIRKWTGTGNLLGLWNRAPAAGADRRRRDHRAARPQAGLEAPARQRRRPTAAPARRRRQARRSSIGWKPTRCSSPCSRAMPIATRSSGTSAIWSCTTSHSRPPRRSAPPWTRRCRRIARYATGTAGPWPRRDLRDAAAPGPVHLRWRPRRRARPGGRDPRGGERPGRAGAAGDGGQGVVTGAGPVDQGRGTPAADRHLPGDLRRHVGRSGVDPSHHAARRLHLRHHRQRAAPARRARTAREAAGVDPQAGGSRRRDAAAGRRPQRAADRPARVAREARYPAGRERRPGSAHRRRHLRRGAGALPRPRDPGAHRRAVTARAGASRGPDDRRRRRRDGGAGGAAGAATWRCARCGSWCPGWRSRCRAATA